MTHKVGERRVFLKLAAITGGRLDVTALVSPGPVMSGDQV